MISHYTSLHYFEGIHVRARGCFQARELFTNMGAEDQRRVLLAAQFFVGVQGKGVRSQEPSRATPVATLDILWQDREEQEIVCTALATMTLQHDQHARLEELSAGLCICVCCSEGKAKAWWEPI